MNLYVLNVRWLYEEHNFFSLLGCVGEDRRKKALSFHFVKDKALSLGAGLLLNFALLSEAPGLMIPPRFRLEAWGKPFLAEHEAPAISLTHSGEYAACAIGREEVGVDIEQVGSADADVACRCFVGQELSRVMPDGHHLDAEEFYRLWTMKESFIKRIGTGLSLDPLWFEILTGERFLVRQDYDTRCYHCKLYEELPGYKLALCMSDGEFPEKVMNIKQDELYAAVTQNIKYRK